LKVLSAEFVTSAAAGGAATGIPRDGLAQFAFAGRSNVGKSSLLNALARQKIARTSAAPGKTRLANIFRITAEGGSGGPGRWSAYFVDLPGYGYARGGDDAAVELAGVAEGYFASGGPGLDARRSIPETVPSGRRAPTAERRPPTADRRLVFLLIDSRHPGLKSDTQAHRWLSGMAAPPYILATKIDKLSRAERTRNLRELERVFGTFAMPVSVTSGEGLDELWRTIAGLARGTGDKADEPKGAERAPR
jgi:GTP-binding protein